MKKIFRLIFLLFSYSVLSGYSLDELLDTSQEVAWKYKNPSASKVYVAGDFNGWNNTAWLMTGPDKDGNFIYRKKLPAGVYHYKFVVDGNWLPDPDNPARTPDGFGGFNSVLRVGQEMSGNWILLASTGASRQLYFSGKAMPSEIVIFVGDRPLAKDHYRSRDNYLWLDLGELSEDTLLRLFYRQPGSSWNNFWWWEVPDRDKSWRFEIIYNLMVDRFCDGNPLNNSPIKDKNVLPLANYLGGDFAGIIQKISDGYFDRLGVTTLWLSPVVDNPDTANGQFSCYHGYSPIDEKKLEEKFGSEQEFGELVQAIHKKNMRLMLDMVFNHVDRQNPLYQKHPEWFSPLVLPDGRKNLRLFDERPLDTWFDESMPDIDYEKNPAAVDYFSEVAVYWINRYQVDAFRLDAVKHVPHCFWRALRQKINQQAGLKRHFYLLGESISDRQKIMEYISPGELSGQFDFPLFWAIRDCFSRSIKDFSALEEERKASENIYGPYLNYNCSLLGNHDFPRFMAYADGDLTWDNPSIPILKKVEVDNPQNYQKLKNAFTFLLTQNQIPLIYYGDEIGLTGGFDPDNRRMMIFDNLSAGQVDLRDWVAKLNFLRRTHPALALGKQITLVAEKDVYIYWKKYFNDDVLIMINRSGEQKITLNLPDYLADCEIINIADGQTKKIVAGKLELILPASRSQVWIKKI